MFQKFKTFNLFTNLNVFTDKMYDNVTWENTTPFIPNLTRGKVIKVYDGDSITIATQLSPLSRIYRFSIRLNGVDCPEIRSKNSVEKRVARIVKNALEEKILGKMVNIQVKKQDKYGRILANIDFQGSDLSEWLISSHYGVPYDGKGKEHIPKNWELYMFQQI